MCVVCACVCCRGEGGDMYLDQTQIYILCVCVCVGGGGGKVNEKNFFLREEQSLQKESVTKQNKQLDN